jgi:sRNA-binding protein
VKKGGERRHIVHSHKRQSDSARAKVVSQRHTDKSDARDENGGDEVKTKAQPPRRENERQVPGREGGRGGAGDRHEGVGVVSWCVAECALSVRATLLAKGSPNSFQTATQR